MSMMQMLLGGDVATSFVAAFTSTTSTVALSGVQAGDLLICASEQNTGVAPSLPSGFTNLASNTSGIPYCASYKVAVGGETSVAVNSGGTNAGAIILQYRGQSLSCGTLSTVSSANSNTPSFAALTPSSSNGRSWVASILFSVGVPATAPSGEINRGSISFVQAFDTNGAVSSFGSRTTSLSGSFAWWTLSVEIQSA